MEFVRRYFIQLLIIVQSLVVIFHMLNEAFAFAEI